MAIAEARVQRNNVCTVVPQEVETRLAEKEGGDARTILHVNQQPASPSDGG